MTVTYTSEVATCNRFGTFWKLLFRWKGGIYKLVWPELFVYTFLYYTCSLVYRFLLDEPQKRTFEKVSLYCQYFIDLIPVSFVLGFYVSIVVTRWWAQYESLPWPDSLALFISTSIHGQDHRSRLMRRTVMRYVNLAQLMTLIMISPAVKKRFPTSEHIVESGFMTENEQKIFDDLDVKTSHPKYWMPLVWAGSIVARARKEGRIRDDFAVKTIIDEINRFRGLCGGLLSYDWISIPLVYTQVVTLSVYTFFLGTIMGRQFLDPRQKIPNQDIDFYVPIFTFLQFFFYMGWLKVAESLVNPFGEDDDDFEVNWLVDRNLQVSYLIVDEMHSEHPELIQDKYWEEIFPTELPYTIASEQFRIEPPQGSTANLEVPEVEQEFLPLLEEEDEDEGIHGTLSDEIQELDNGETKAININAIGSARSLLSGKSSSQQSTTRKPSVLSMIVHRMKGSNDNLKARNINKIGSTTSMRQVRRRGLNRSTSRMSTASQVTSQSRDSVRRNPTIATESSAIFRMSDLSINSADVEEQQSPRMRGGGIFSSHDEDEPIHIKIKRRDQDGRVINSPSSDEFDCGMYSSRAHLIRKSNDDDTSDGNIQAKDNQLDKKSLGSSCSIRTSIFQAEDGDGKYDEEIKAQVQTTKKKGVMQGLKGAFSKIRSQEPQDIPAKGTSYIISKWLNNEGKPEEDSESADLLKKNEASASLPVSPSTISTILLREDQRTTKSMATLESHSPDVTSLLKELSPIEKVGIVISEHDPENNAPQGEDIGPFVSTPISLTDPSDGQSLFKNAPPIPQPVRLTGETKINISKDTLDIPAQVVGGLVDETVKSATGNMPELKLPLTSDKELEPIPEVDDSNGLKGKDQLWV